MQEHISSALRVLVVDDNVDTAASLASLFRSWGHDVVVAHDGPEALRAAAGHRPHAVLLDIGLPLMDGFEVAERLRGLPGGDEVFIAAASGYNRDADRRRADEVDIDAYLVKPFDPFRLEGLLASRLAATEAVSA
jgi:CheY-like chemotaxis protein